MTKPIQAPTYLSHFKTSCSYWQRRRYWQRRHIMYTSTLLFVLLLTVLEFSFSRIFAMYAITFMMAFKIVWVYMESWLLKALNEKLMALPFECALQTAQFVMTLGASGFIQFITNNKIFMIFS